MQRALLTEFALKNPYYAAASVTVYEVNENLLQTATLATLYVGPIGGALRPNPISLDSEGKFPGPVYVSKPVVMVVTPSDGPAQTLGVSGIVPRWRGIWAAATLYYPSERVRDPAGPATYIVINGHISNSFVADVAAGLLQEEIDADAITDALADDVLGTVIPITPASGYLRINAGGNGVEGRTPAQVIDDLGALSRSGGTLAGPLVLPGLDPVAANQATRKAYVDALVAAVSAAANPPGKVDQFAMSSPPPGWLFCDGSEVSRATYAGLFSAIGTTHGAGDGATTFNLPDYRGVFLRGLDAGRGLDPGRAFPSYQADLFGSHNHGGAISTSAAGDHQHTYLSISSGGSGNTNVSGSNFGFGLTGTAGNHQHTVTIPSSGGAETRPKNATVYICIKT